VNVLVTGGAGFIGSHLVEAHINLQELQNIGQILERIKIVPPITKLIIKYEK